MTRKSTFLVFHEYEQWDKDDWKLIGAYRSRDDAEAAIDRARALPGFRDWPDGFVIDEYDVGRDHWPEGLKTVLPIHVPVLNAPGDQLEIVEAVWMPGDLFRIESCETRPLVRPLVFTAGQVVKCEERTVEGVTGCLVAVEAVQ